MSEQNPVDSNFNQLFWGASQLFLVGVVSRFHRNYKRFANTESSIVDPVDRDSLLELSRAVLYKQRVYLTLSEKNEHHPEMNDQISALLLQQQISDHLDDLHVRLLEHDTELITPLIPEIDRQRKCWKWDADSTDNDSRHYGEVHSSFIRWRDELRNRL